MGIPTRISACLLFLEHLLIRSPQLYENESIRKDVLYIYSQYSKNRLDLVIKEIQNGAMKSEVAFAFDSTDGSRVKSAQEENIWVITQTVITLVKITVCSLRTLFQSSNLKHGTKRYLQESSKWFPS